MPPLGHRPPCCLFSPANTLCPNHIRMSMSSLPLSSSVGPAPKSVNTGSPSWSLRFHSALVPKRQLLSLPTPAPEAAAHKPLLANCAFLTSKISCEERQLSPHLILLWVSRKKELQVWSGRGGVGAHSEVLPRLWVALCATP